MAAIAHPRISNPHQFLSPSEGKRDIDVHALNEAAGLQRPMHTTELMALATGAGRDGSV